MHHCHRGCPFHVLGYEDVGLKLEASIKMGVDGVKIKLDQARVGSTCVWISDDISFFGVH